MTADTTSPAAPKPAPSKVPMVIIAASAGGLDPISEILDSYPTDLPVATVVIQHLSPSYRSELVRLLQLHTAQPVRELGDNTVVEAGCIYVIQPGTQIMLDHQHVRAVTRNEFKRPYFTIDVFLESVARRSAPIDACVVLLSGTGSDGTAGCRAMFESGGYVLVQQLADAKFDGMPLSVINSGAYHEVLPVNAIAERILAWLAAGCQVPPPPQFETVEADPLQMLYASSPNPPFLGDMNPYLGIFGQLRNAFDLDLHAYKIGTIERRINQRMRRLGLTSIAQYEKLLAQGGGEMRALFADLMIGVTSFFRNPQVFELLESRVLPDLLDRSKGPLKLWVCACSTGEEAYSIAMLMQKLVLQRGCDPEFRIYATDINPESVRRASEGTHEYGALQPFIARFGLEDFVRSNEEFGHLRINSDIRRKIVFSVQNVIKHSPLHALDMILCRNMLIYLRPEAQRKVISNFHFGLKEDGILLLGESEGPAGLDPYFQEIDGRLKVFSKRAGVELSASDRWQLNRSIAPISSIRPGNTMYMRDTASSPIARSAFESAFASVAGNSLIVRSDGEVQYVTGHAGEIFARALPGRPGLSLHWHVTDLDLQALLQLGVGEASESERPVQLDFHYRRVENNGLLNFNALRFTQLPSPFDQMPCVLVQMLGEHQMLLDSQGTGDTTEKGSPLLAQLQHVDGGLERLAKLERHNAELRQIVSESVQDKETFHEELQSANEELLSSNEELQSTNEELQSVNEELHSVNAELAEKIRLLTDANNDISNLLSTTDVALLLLDESLRIRRFTDSARKHFPLGLQDIGRPIGDLASNLLGIDIPAISHAAMTNRQTQQHETQTGDRSWLKVTFHPYIDQDGRARGVVLTIYDVSQLRNLLRNEEQARLRRELVERTIGLANWEVSDTGSDHIELSASFDMRQGHVVGEPPISSRRALHELFHPDDLPLFIKAKEDAIACMNVFSVECRIRHQDGRYLWTLCNGAAYRESDGSITLLGVFADIDARKRQEALQRAAEQDDIHSNRIFNMGILVSGVAHELNNPLAALQLGTERLLEMETPPQANVIRQVANAQMKAINRMDRIISSLLRFARKDSEAEIRSVYVHTLLRDVHELTHSLADESQVTLHVVLPPSQLRLHCDPVEIAQALVNLVVNAIQHVASLPERWVRLEVELTNNSYEFRVTDSGLTSAICEPEQLFTPFYTTKGVGNGTGLGLSLSQGIAEAHGGRLGLQRNSFNTCFAMTIPSQEQH